MFRTILLAALMVPALAMAQAAAQATPGHHADGMTAAPLVKSAAAMPLQPGQGAFAAIQEIVQFLEADPATDWSKVNIGALREHLIDMDNVMLRAEVANKPIDGGMLFTVSGTGDTRDSIQRMATAHAAMMDGISRWQYAAAQTETGATLTVKAPLEDAQKLRALGFIGILTRGMHHQLHHLLIAQGGRPHH